MTTEKTEKKTVNDILNDLAQSRFETPYQVETQAPPLPPDVAALFESEDGLCPYPDDDKVAGLDLETLARLYHQARRYRERAEKTFNREIAWLAMAERDVQRVKRETGISQHALECEWRRRQTTEPITWQGVRKVLNDAGFVQRARYSWEQKQGTIFSDRKGDETTVYVTFENMIDLTRGQDVLEQAGYTIKRVYDPDNTRPGDYHEGKPHLTVVKLREGQTLDDVNQPYTPPQTTGPTDG